MRYGKKTKQGRAERAALIETEWPGVINRLRSILPSGYANDDLLDAVAVLWSTIRHARQRSNIFPSKVDRDEYGLPMQIVS